MHLNWEIMPGDVLRCLGSVNGSSRSGTRDRYRRPGLAVDGALRPGRQRAFLGQTDLEMLVVLGGRQPQPDTDFAALVHGQHVHLLGVRRIYSEQVRLVPVTGQAAALRWVRAPSVERMIAPPRWTEA